MIEAAHDRAFAGAGLPSTTRVFVQETNVNREQCRTDEQRAEKLGVLLDALYDDNRVQGLLIYSLWTNPGNAPLYRLSPGDPAWDVLRDFALTHRP
jgi:hypothetical protein